MVQENRRPDREEEHSPPNKRSKTAANQQNPDHNAPPSEEILLNKLPLGLKLRKSPSLIELIQKRLNQSRQTQNPSSKLAIDSIKSTTENKPKATNFPASLLKIGNWEFNSRHEGDLVAKFYFAKKKIVWEVIENGLKNKIEIEWSNIESINANCPDNGPGTLHIVVSKKPRFFKETNPQPKKHSIWKSGSDFTNGNASVDRRHFLQCPEGVLNKHFEKLVQFDTRLRLLSQKEPDMLAFGESEGRRIQNSASEIPVIEIPDSPDSVENWDRIIVPGIQKSISVSDFLNEIEEQVVSGNLSTENRSECQEMLEGIAEFLLSDAEFITSGDDSDEKVVMSRVNSLCCLLQKDDTGESMNNVCNEPTESTPHEGDVKDGETSRMSRKDSFVELLFNLPRIASLPKMLFNISEEEDGGRS